MMEKESIELKDRISKLADEELLTMVNVKALDYRKEALDYAVVELADRALLLPRMQVLLRVAKRTCQCPSITFTNTYIDELRRGHRRQEISSLLGQSTFKWWRMLLSKNGRDILPYPDRFTRHDIKSVTVNLNGTFTFYVGANSHTYKIGARRRKSLCDSLWEGELLRQPIN
jgi:hypothetical protein